MTEVLDTMLYNYGLRKCPDGWLRVSESCFWYSPHPVNYTMANQTCTEKVPGGKLYEPQNLDENNQVMNFVKGLPNFDSYWGPWIGVNDEQAENEFIYTYSKQPVAFANWADGKPNGGR